MRKIKCPGTSLTLTPRTLEGLHITQFVPPYKEREKKERDRKRGNITLPRQEQTQTKTKQTNTQDARHALRCVALRCSQDKDKVKRQSSCLAVVLSVTNDTVISVMGDG